MNTTEESPAKFATDTVSGEEIPIEDARTCDRCGAVHDKTGPISFEPGRTYCGHWVCEECQSGHFWSERCAACMEENEQ